jgi:nucleotide-binding universal stress UspA family protein
MTRDVPLIVVGVDGSECAQKALVYAIEEAQLRKARIRIVSAWSVPVMIYAGGYVPGLDPGTFELAAEKEAEDALAEVRRTAPELEADAGSPNASPAEALLDAADAGEAALIVVGSRGLGGFERLLLGSVSQQVAQHAHCVVTIVRETPSDDGASR